MVPAAPLAETVGPSGTVTTVALDPKPTGCAPRCSRSTGGARDRFADGDGPLVRVHPAGTPDDRLPGERVIGRVRSRVTLLRPRVSALTEAGDGRDVQGGGRG